MQPSGTCMLEDLELVVVLEVVLDSDIYLKTASI